MADQRCLRETTRLDYIVNRENCGGTALAHMQGFIETCIDSIEGCSFNENCAFQKSRSAVAFSVALSALRDLNSFVSSISSWNAMKSKLRQDFKEKVHVYLVKYSIFFFWLLSPETNHQKYLSLKKLNITLMGHVKSPDMFILSRAQY